MKRRFYFIYLFIVVFCATGVAQDTHFSQYYANPLYLAPSLAGSSQQSRVAAQYRDQWPSIPGKFVAYSFSADHYFQKFKSGVGLRFLKEEMGTSGYNVSQAALSYSYYIKLNRKWSFRPGVGIYYSQRSVDRSKTIFGDQLYGDENSPSLSYSKFKNVSNVDVEASAMFNTENYWVGATLDHLARPDVSFMNRDYKLPIRYSLFTGYRFVFRRPYKKEFRYSITVSANYYLQGQNDQLDLGVYWNYKKFLAGFWYRGLPSFKQNAISDAAILMLGYDFHGVKVAYSYDLTISKLGPSTGGAHEIAFSYSFDLKPREKLTSVPCPHF